MIDKICKNCTSKFIIADEDIIFYKRVSPEINSKLYEIPAPTLCPDCRTQRRMATRNQTNLYQRTCDFSGEKILSLYSPDKPFKVYKEEIWWSDKWDPMDYGRDFDFSRPFFDQYYELMLKVPRRAMHQDGTNENCEYTTFGQSNKNSYLLFTCFLSEDCFYGRVLFDCKDCCDSFRCLKCQLIYECIDCENCYNCLYCVSSQNCEGSMLLDSCNNCKNCIGCKNLRNKEYCIYNKQVSKEEFERYRENLMKNPSELEKEIKKFDKWKIAEPTLYSHIRNSENCTGDYIENAKNCHHCFDGLIGAEDMKYCQFCGYKGKDLYDCSMAGSQSELCYELTATSMGNHSAFCNFLKNSSNIYYCEMINACSDCFACIGLNYKKYCILNKQYTKEEYEELMPKIIDHMIQGGEWGQSFPLKYSPFAYNETWASEQFPLSKEEVLKIGGTWKDEEKIQIEPSENGCKQCGKAFKVISQENKLYEKLKIQAPKICPRCRHDNRIKKRNPYKLWSRTCTKCATPLETSYSPDRPEIIYCEKCYLETVY